jgi:hypothetical protein
MLQWKMDLRVVAEGYCTEAVIELAAGTDLFGRRLAGRSDLQEAAGLRSDSLEKALSIGCLCERCTFHRR